MNAFFMLMFDVSFKSQKIKPERNASCAEKYDETLIVLI